MSFYTIIIDFILILSKSFVEDNYIIFITDKFSKVTTIIASKVR